MKLLVTGGAGFIGSNFIYFIHSLPGKKDLNDSLWNNDIHYLHIYTFCGKIDGKENGWIF